MQKKSLPAPDAHTRVFFFSFSHVCLTSPKETTTSAHDAKRSLFSYTFMLIQCLDSFHFTFQTTWNNSFMSQIIRTCVLKWRSHFVNITLNTVICSLPNYEKQQHGPNIWNVFTTINYMCTCVSQASAYTFHVDKELNGACLHSSPLCFNALFFLTIWSLKNSD